MQAVVTRELTLYGSCSSAGEYSKAIEMVASGAIQVTPLISAIAPLADGPQWFERLYAREPGLMKVILKPHPSDLDTPSSVANVKGTADVPSTTTLSSI